MYVVLYSQPKQDCHNRHKVAEWLPIWRMQQEKWQQKQSWSLICWSHSRRSSLVLLHICWLIPPSEYLREKERRRFVDTPSTAVQILESAPDLSGTQPCILRDQQYDKRDQYSVWGFIKALSGRVIIFLACS